MVASGPHLDIHLDTALLSQIICIRGFYVAQLKNRNNGGRTDVQWRFCHLFLYNIYHNTQREREREREMEGRVEQ